METKEEPHCVYYHDENGVCMNQSCRETICNDEWNVCIRCQGNGFIPKSNPIE